MKIKTLLLSGLTAIALSSSLAFAQGYYSPYGYDYNPNTYNSGSYYPSYNYNNYSYNNAYGNAYNSNPYQNYSYNYANPYGYAQPYGYPAPYYGYKKKDSGFDRFFNEDKMPFSGNSDFAEELWPGRDSIYEDMAPIDGPWNRNWGRAPWNRDYANMYEPEGGPDKWFDLSDPKEGLAWAWEDFLVTPNALGTMPGGWEAPSIIVPNPVDVGDEFKNAAGDMPGEMKDFSEGFTYGDDGYNNNPDAGSIGMGKKKKKDGINIQPKTYR